MKIENINKFKNLISSTNLLKIKYKFNEKIKYLFAKCEWLTLTGSIKDKVAFQIIFDAIKSGKIKSGDEIVEVTSGNMGISISAMANLFNLKAKIIMPKNMSKERKDLIKLYGAELIEVEDFPTAFSLCNKFEKKGIFCSHQFENFSNTKAHKIFTAKEIISKLKTEKPTAFIAGVGTSGTLTGVGKILKQKYNLKIVGIEPVNARILSGKKPFSHHKLQGLSDEILPKLYDQKLIDTIIQISDDDAIAMAQKLCKELSLGVGISSGANLIGAILTGNNSITILPDDNKKYLSTDLTTPIETDLTKRIEFLSFEVLY